MNSIQDVKLIGKEKILKEKDKQKDNPLVQIQELKLSHQQEMTSLRNELAEIKNLLGSPQPGLPNQPLNQHFNQPLRNHFGNYGNEEIYIPPHRRNGQQVRFGKKKSRCKKCEINNVQRCLHCFVCGASEHMSFS